MQLFETNFDGLIEFIPKIISDDRGYFMQSFVANESIFNMNFVQENESMSFKGVLRGLHFQKPPFEQAKLVRCLEGEVIDIALDIRKSSKTYAKHHSTLLSKENKKHLFIPRGFAHGFIVLSEYAVISYKVDNFYNPSSESGIFWDDNELNIDWKLKKSKIITSSKDQNLPLFRDINSPF